MLSVIHSIIHSFSHLISRVIYVTVVYNFCPSVCSSVRFSGTVNSQVTPSARALNTQMVGEICVFWQTPAFISEMVKDRPKVTIDLIGNHRYPIDRCQVWWPRVTLTGAMRWANFPADLCAYTRTVRPTVIKCGMLTRVGMGVVGGQPRSAMQGRSQFSFETSTGWPKTTKFS